jgi:hypothetical protein
MWNSSLISYSSDHFLVWKTVTYLMFGEIRYISLIAPICNLISDWSYLLSISSDSKSKRQSYEKSNDYQKKRKKKHGYTLIYFVDKLLPIVISKKITKDKNIQANHTLRILWFGFSTMTKSFLFSFRTWSSWFSFRCNKFFFWFLHKD